MNEISAKTDNTIYLNFEDEAVLANINNCEKLIEYVEKKEYYVQVAYSVEDDKAYKKEFEAFANMDNAHKKIIITNDNIDYSTSTVTHIKLKDFLLMNDLA